MRLYSVQPILQSKASGRLSIAIPTLGCDKFNIDQRFCQAVNEVGKFLKPCTHMTEFVYLF